MGERSDGYRGAFHLHRWGAAPQASFRIDANALLDIGVEHLDDHRSGDRGIPSQNDRPAPVSRRAFFGSPRQNFADATVDAFHARHEYAGPAWSFRSTFRATRTDRLYQNLHPRRRSRRARRRQAEGLPPRAACNCASTWIPVASAKAFTYRWQGDGPWNSQGATLRKHRPRRAGRPAATPWRSSGTSGSSAGWRAFRGFRSAYSPP